LAVKPLSRYQRFGGRERTTRKGIATCSSSDNS
jgi:hypothetical protein